MSDDNVQTDDGTEEAVLKPRRGSYRRILAVLGIVLLVAVVGSWLARERIANRIIAGQLQDYGLPATYALEQVGPNRQILTNIVIGDPAHPDLTVERAVIETELTFGTPTLGRITLTRPRLYGRITPDGISFGALDKVLFAKRAGPKGLPDLDLGLIDGRARIDSPYGAIGLKADGAGNLRGGFAGTLAAVAPQLSYGDCRAQQVSAYGKVTVTAAEPRFAGPLRLHSLDCPKRQLALRNATVVLDAKLGAQFNSAQGSFGLDSGALALPGAALAAANGSGAFAFTNGDLTAKYKLTGRSLSASGVKVAQLAFEGTLASADHFSTVQSHGLATGLGVSAGAGLERSLGELEQSGSGSLLGPLAGQFRAALAREAPGSSFSAGYDLRQTGALTSLTVPGAVWLGGSGARLVTLSQLSLVTGGRAGPRFSGNVVTGGNGLPQITGRFEQNGSGGGRAKLSLAEYRAGDSLVALPDLQIVQLPGGAIGFAGLARVSGALPGGRIENLALPIEGNWSPSGGLAALRRCTPVSFSSLKVANLNLAGQTLTLCPGSAGAIFKSDARGVRVSAGASNLALAGTLGTTPVRLRSGAVGLAWPGNLAARNIDASAGPLNKPTTLKIAQLNAVLGKVVTGTFAGTDLKLYAVPLDVFGAAGKWRFAGGDLAVSGASLTVKDRELDARFYPLVARDAALQLHSTTFTAQALLREPKSDRAVVETLISHDLDTARGHADLNVAGITFDSRLQPETLTRLTQGVVALAKGTVSGKGQIDWNDQGVTSSGDFGTDWFDFAAQFGPVKGTRGTVHFTDLLALITAPHQHLKVASINPGIEVNDGDVDFQLEADHLLVVNGATWPFIDGTLTLQPTRMVLGAAETRHLTIKVDGINAAKFVQRLELANISASGTFDGTLPLIFDQEGGRIEGGLLVSRPPGGNLSYVGELTYKDLSPMGNFAFAALRSLDFRRMEIAIEGHIDGELVTKMRIDGVRQGAGAKRNFLTKRLAGLPIQFNINIRGPFQQLITSFKSLYDPEYVRDPRSLGLIAPEPKAPLPKQPAPALPPPPAVLPSAPPPAPKDTDIQPSDSRTTP